MMMSGLPLLLDAANNMGISSVNRPKKP